LSISDLKHDPAGVPERGCRRGRLPENDTGAGASCQLDVTRRTSSMRYATTQIAP
jgi:hypothetical protein